nr:TPA_inf: conotoxin precursor F [Conus ebraeus]DAZ85972.1 TPA_inf: conotoxin precursor F [Conus ebraeus]DAZ86153.1 TPA_inf: conotoxin precursor F [Conus ebraeus]
MQRGAVLLGVVAFLALWSQAAAEEYDLNDPDVLAIVDEGQKLMHACSIANKYTYDPWWKLNILAFKEMRVYHSMMSDMVTCLNHFFRRRHEEH